MRLGQNRGSAGKTTRSTTAKLLCVAAEVAAICAAAAAQAAPQQQQLEEVTVTARRRTERAQTVPSAITAISGAELKRRGVTNTNDLQHVVPSLTIGGQQRSNSQYYLRGQTPGVINQGVHNNASVTVYFLEVPTLISGPGTFFDMADVQVLKGPQGTLFGRNTTGGAILFTPEKPHDDTSGYIRGQYGTYNDRELEGAVNFPLLPDKLDLRVSGNIARRDGFTTNVDTGEKLDDRNYDAYRISLTAHINDDLTNLLVLDGRLINQNGTSAIPTEFNPNVTLRANVFAGTPLPVTPLKVGGNGPSLYCLQGYAPPSESGFGYTGVIPGCPAGGLGGTLAAALKAGEFSYYPTSYLNGLLAQQRALGPRQIASDANFFDQERSFDATNITTWQINDDLLLKNIAGYRFNRVNQASDFDGTVIPLVRNTNTQSDWGEDAVQTASDELQLQGTAFASHLHYILGTYFENSDPGQPTISRATEFAPPPSYASAQPLYNELLLFNSVINYHKFNDKDESVFAHGDYDLGDLYPGLKAAAGIRYTWDEREASIDQLDGSAQCVAKTQIYAINITKANPAGDPICATRETAAFSAPTWSAQLSEQFDPTTLLYISERRGFKTGGFNLPSPRSVTTNVPYDQAFGPEYVFSSEIGLKKDWHIGEAALRSNVAVFHDIYTSIQSSFATVTGGDIAAVVINAGKGHIDGLEVEQTVVPFPNFQFGGYFSLLRAVYAEPFVLETVQLIGHQLPYSPIQKYGANATYSFPIDAKYGKLALTADWSLSTHYETADPLDPNSFFKGSENENIRLDWGTIYGKPLDLSIVSTNLLNRTYATGGYPIYGLAGFRSDIYNEPRMVFGQVTVHWGPGATW